ncbi:ABCA12, partial [Cervus elaphus hippelaphus]
YMKMMGVNSCSHFFAWLIESVGFLLITIVILIIILKFGNILPKTNGFILFLYFSDYSFSVIAMSYLISVFFNSTNIAALIGSLIYIIAFFPFIVLITVENELSYVIKVFMSLLSPTAFSYASQYIARYEEQGIGLQWENMYSSPVQDDTTSFGWLCCLILADSFIYFLIAWYVRNVFPGTYGMAAPWYFPFLPSYWKERLGCAEVNHEKSNGLMFTNIMMQNTNPSASKTSPEYKFSSNIEPEPKDLTVGVALHGVTKIYGSKIAVDNLNLNFYEGHITSLLGPNGAGKTTTISMLTGLFGASAGTIFVYGKDIRTDLHIVRKNMGVCMQHDVLFSYLTTKEHLLLYGSIKVPHWTKKQLHEEVKRTIILSTHHLDEAEVLSDRIAFLEQGGLRCCGSPFYLKEAFGDGYHLTLTKKKSPNLNASTVCDTTAVTAMIQSHLPDAYLKEDIGGELVYVLPPFSTKVSGAYLSLLRALDRGLGDLNIGCYGISDTTVEEVFLNLTKESQKSNMSLEHLTPKKIGSSSTNGISTPDDLSVWYDPEGYHSLPAYLNSLNNFLLRVNMSKYDAARHGVQDQEQATMSSLIDILVALSILMGYSVTTASFVTYVVREHQTKAKQLQHISGISVTCYWVTNFIYDMAFYLVPVAFSIGVIAIFKLPAFYSENNLSAVSLLLLLFGYATFSWMYLLAGFFHDTGMAFITYVCINLFFGINSIVSLSVVYFLSKEKPNDTTLELISETLKRIFLIFPQFCFGYGLIELSQQQSVLDFLKAYGVEYPSETFEMDKLGAMFVALVSQGTMFFFLRLLINEWLINKLRKFSSSSVIETIDEDEDVQAERFRVEKGANDYDLVQLHRLTKTYQLIHKKIIACFGLLGVNGAGKTTIFKMLTGDIIPTSGNILIRNKTGSLIGYCPQEDALDDLVTIEEHLYFYARIHGIPEKDIKETVQKLLGRLHLLPYKDTVTAMCSYGTKRKLSTALALIGKPSILLLDEPSSGMDPKSKRHLWKIISEEVQNKCSVILTSHSMEECEALCTRLAIMVNGRFQCIGSLQHIKSRFGRGFTVKVHVKNARVSMEALTRFMQLHFPKTYLKDQHLSMLEYHVPVTAGGVANIFDLLEANKTALNITNFLVSQTTLEEVFINFAKDQKCYETADTSSQGSIVSTDSQDDQL